MSDWIELGAPQRLSSVEKNIKGQRLTVYVSPHAIPRALRATYDKESGVFRIDFRYLDDAESSISLAQASSDGKAKIYIGKDSGRIERIDVQSEPSSDTFNLQIVVELAEKILTQVESSNPSLSLRLNATAALQAVEGSHQSFVPVF